MQQKDGKMSTGIAARTVGGRKGRAKPGAHKYPKRKEVSFPHQAARQRRKSSALFYAINRQKGEGPLCADKGRRGK